MLLIQTGRGPRFESTGQTAAVGATGVSVASFDDDMHRLKEGIKAMQVAYNRYFTGALDRPPVEMQSSLSAIIREHTINTEGQRTADRFRLNALVSRFHILTEMWNRNVRQMEEGRPAALDRRGTQVDVSKKSGDRELYRARFQAGRSSPENPQMQKLYESYLLAIKAGDTSKGSLSYRNFYAQVHRRMEKCQEKTGCAEMMLRVLLVDNRPVLKVKSTS